MKNITVKTTFTAIAALFFATSLYAIDMKSNEMSMTKVPMPMTKESMSMQNDKMAVLCSSCTKV
jgi:hypothetical protein